MEKKFKKYLPFFFSLKDGQLQLLTASPNAEIIKLESYAFGRSSLDAVVNGEIIDKALIGKMISTLALSSQPKPINSNFCHINLSDNYLFSKYLILPKVKEKELEQTIHYKIRDFLPHLPEDMYLDWYILNENNGLLEVSVAAVKKTIIDSYLETLRPINIYPLGFEPESCSLARMVDFASPEPNLVIYYNGQTVTLAFVEKGGVLFVSTCGYSYNGEKDAEVLEEIDKAAKFWQVTFNKSKTLKNIYIAGCIPRELVICKAIKEAFKIEAKKLPLPIAVPAGISPERVKMLTPLFGFSLSQIESQKSKKGITLIPPKIQEERELFKFKKNLKNILKITSLILLIFLSFYSFIFLSMFFRLEKTKASLSGFEIMVVTPAQQNLEKKALDINEKVFSLENVYKRKQKVSNILLDFIHKIPGGIVINDLSFDGRLRQIKIKGIASSRKNILSLEKALSGLGQVTTPLSSFEESKDAQFSITLQLKK